MGKSIIPFIIENPYLRNIFIDASITNDLSSIFYFSLHDVNTFNKKKFQIIITDNLFFKKILTLNITCNKIFLIGDANNYTLDKQVNSEIIKVDLPFKMLDICQRIENDLIQISSRKRRLHNFNSFFYDPSTRILSNNIVSLRFTEKESQIFICLAENINAFISKKELLKQVWTYGDDIDTHTLETHVYALRKKIETELNINDLIMFEEKKGYYLNKSLL
tara:strand:- start:564 stop:1223 length:660 start_codon:yes stop_codon:yes gene_type:complete